MVKPYLLLSSSGENFFRFLVALFAFIIVLIATYYVSKWTAGYQKAKLSSGNFELIDSMRISSNKYLMIVRIGRSRYFSVGVGKDEMVLLGELSKEELFQDEITSAAKSGRSSQSFAGIVSSLLKSSEKSEHHED